MKRLLLLIPLIAALVLFCAIYRVKNSVNTEKDTTDTTKISEETSGAPETTTAGVLDRLLGKDQKTEKATKKAGKTKAQTTAASEKKTARSAEKTTAKTKGGMLSDEELKLIEELGVTFDGKADGRTPEITMKMSDEIITDASGEDGKKPSGSGRNSSPPSGSGGGSGSSGGSGGGSETGTVTEVSTPDKEILNSGKYTLKAVAKRNNGTPISFTLYANGGKYALSTRINVSDKYSKDVKIILSGNNIQFVLPEDKYYADGGNADEYKFKKEVFDDIIIPVTSTAEKATLVNIGFVEIGGTEYVVEEYKADSGQTVKYYILGDKIERIEIINEDGGYFIIEISSLSGSVPSDAFTVPSGYTNITKATDSLLGYFNVNLKEKSIL